MTKQKSNLNFFKRVGLEALWLLCRAISITPHWFRYYLLSDLIFFILYRCLRYRVAVVDKNLRNSFLDLSESERGVIRKEFYHYLSEVFVSTISLAGGNPAATVIRKDESGDYGAIGRFKEEIAGRPWVALTAHYGLWEYFMFWSQFTGHSMVAVYHPLENEVFEELFKRLRNYKTIYPVAAKDTVRFCLEHKDGIDGRNLLVGLIADQNPPRRSNSVWFKFLNQDSIFFDGGEKIALKFKLPVYFVYQRRLKRGLYEYDYELIHDGVEEIAPDEITRRYVEKLERVICENPAIWLWSHRRWKHNPNKWKHMKQS